MKQETRELLEREAALNLPASQFARMILGVEDEEDDE